MKMALVADMALNHHSLTHSLLIEVFLDDLVEVCPDFLAEVCTNDLLAVVCGNMLLVDVWVDDVV